MRAAVYLRISEDRTGEALGVQRQREDAHAELDRRGWTLAGEYVDNDRSAAKGKARPEFDAMLRSCEAGEIDTIIAWSHDRLTRNRRDELRLIEACQDRNVIIALCRGSDIDLTTPAGRMTADILASVARHEIEQKADRTRRANEQAAQAGKPPGGPRTFGYEPDGMTIREAEAEALRSAYRAVLRGSSLTSIARAWNGAGLYSGRKGWKTGEQVAWTNITVRRALLNPRHGGLRRYKGEIIGKAAWPGVVDEETFRAAEHVLTNPDRATRYGRPERRLLSGLAFCGACGSTVHAGGGTSRRDYTVYRCSTRKGAGTHVNRRADAVEEYVRDVTLEFLTRPDMSEVFAPTTEDNSALVNEANRLRMQLETLGTEFANGTIGVVELRSGSEYARARLNEVEQQLASAATAPAVADLLRAENVRARWDSYDTERQRMIIGTLWEVRLHPVGTGVREFRPETVGLIPRW